MIGRDRLVQDVVAQDRRIAGVAPGDGLPELHRELPVARHVEHQGIARPVVVVDAGLAAGCGVQVDDGEKPGLAHPAQHAVEQEPALARDLAVGVHEQPVVQRDTNGVEADRLDEDDVVLSDVGVAELPPEGLRALGPQQAVEGAVDLARRLRHLELEHVALGHQPVAEADALDQQRAAVGRDEVLALDTDEGIGAC